METWPKIEGSFVLERSFLFTKILQLAVKFPPKEEEDPYKKVMSNSDAKGRHARLTCAELPGFSMASTAATSWPHTASASDPIGLRPDEPDNRRFAQTGRDFLE